MKKSYIPPICLALFLSGCRVGPTYYGPEAYVPREWHSEVTSTKAPDDLAWWKNLQDPMLDQLIEYAADQNLDLKIAAMRVLQARAEVKAKKGDLYPHADASANYDHLYYSKDALVNGLLGTALPVGCKHVQRNVNFYEVGFDADWEIDLFGLTAHEIAAAKAHADGVEDALCHVWVTLSAEIAKNYIELRGLQRRLDIAKKSIDNQSEAVRLSEELYTKGFISESDYSQIQSQLNIQKADLPLLEQSISRTIHRLSILLGYPPGDLFECLAKPASLPQIPSEATVGMPSDLLRRRPDIRRAERELAAATERVGSAVASLFPRFSLRAFVGDISTRAGSLFSPASATWLAGPQVLLPIFNSHLILQDIEYNKLLNCEAIYTYQKTVLEALEEAENAISSLQFGQERYKNLTESYQLNQKSAAFAKELYDKGFSDHFALIKAEQTFAIADDAMVQAQVDLLLDYVALYKALGGSWTLESCY